MSILRLKVATFLFVTESDLIVGIGTDIIEIDRVRAVWERHGERFLRRVFTKGEQEYCLKKKRNSIESLAGRFAAKEAVMKALGHGQGQGILWKEIEVLRADTGKPSIRLTGGAAEIAERQGVSVMHISISHCKEYATAYAIAAGSDAR